VIVAIITFIVWARVSPSRACPTRSSSAVFSHRLPVRGLATPISIMVRPGRAPRWVLFRNAEGSRLCEGVDTGGRQDRHATEGNRD
jgi:hypothetical protein